jgi:hypothetical protein
MAVTVYVGGPISSYGPERNWNLDGFAAMTTRLRDAGFEVINPQELHEPSESVEWSWYMRRDIPELCRADVLVLLDGWEESWGARLENVIAFELGLRIVEPADFEDWLSEHRN